MVKEEKLGFWLLCIFPVNQNKNTEESDNYLEFIFKTVLHLSVFNV